MSKIVVIDYGMGNLLSVKRACNHLGYDVLITEDAKKLKDASYVILPGVGAFPHAIEQLKQKGFIPVIKQYVLESKKNFLGICLGMQLMMSFSSEFGMHDGLDLIEGSVDSIPQAILAQGYKIPYIGWSNLRIIQKSRAPLLKGITEKDQFYFVHSYMSNPKKEENRYADTYYGKERISSIIGRENAYGCQFHPEKSGLAGLRILQNFFEL